MALEDPRINVKLRLSALWACTMLFYIYNDYFSLLAPGNLQAIIDGKGMLSPPGAEWKLVAAAVSITIPNLMIILSLAMKAAANRWTNIITGVLYAAIIVFTILPADTHAFYRFLGVVEVAMSALVVWQAWTWPRREAPAEGATS